MTEDEKPTLEQRLLDGRAKAVRDARQATGMTQAELAVMAGTSQQTVDRIERGAVEHSRAYPRIAKALGIPNEGFDYDRITKSLAKLEENSKANYDSFMNEGRFASLVATENRVPVVMMRNLELRMVDAIPRGFPVEHAGEAFAVRIFGSEMEPVLRNGDTVIANPIIPPLPGCEFCMMRQNDIFVRTFLRETTEAWIVKSWTPEFEEPVLKTTVFRSGSVVARISRSY